ncbi:hypothetical protein [Halorussus salinisoli]|uniref:hypothetical protein n=1 Tax=Halorussus salinisoli TaxID=2558242 RepID=UPI0010C20D0F|nr:hypothetical protein [Halorussus salinisoli]
MHTNGRTVWGVALLVVVSLGVVAGPSVAAPTEPRQASDARLLDSQANETNESTQYPPGVTAEGVTNVSALVAAHQGTLSQTGFEYTFSENISYFALPNGTSFGNETTVGTETAVGTETTAEAETAVGTEPVPEIQTTVGNGSIAGNGSFWDGYFFNNTTTVITENGTVARGLAPSLVVAEGYVEYDDYREAYRDETWANETVVLSRTEFPNQFLLSRTDLVENGGENPFNLTRSDLNATLTKADIVNYTLHTGQFEVAETEQTENGSLFTLEADEYDGSDVLYVEPENVSTYDATLVVDEKGRVHHLSFDFEGSDYERVSLHYEFELTHVGPVNVTRPPWTDRLRR